MMRRKRFVFGVGAASAALAITLSACSPGQPGAAAMVGSAAITDTQLTTQVSKIVEGLGINPDDQVNRVILQRLVLEQLVAQLAAEHNVSVAEGEIQTFVAAQVKQAGSQANFEATMLRNGVPPTAIPSAVRMALALGKIGEVIAPKRTQQERQIAVSMAAMNLAGQETIAINPRFGTWDPATLQIQPTPDTVSKPAPIPDNGLNIIPQLR